MKAGVPQRLALRAKSVRHRYEEAADDDVRRIAEQAAKMVAVPTAWVAGVAPNDNVWAGTSTVYATAPTQATTFNAATLLGGIAK